MDATFILSSLSLSLTNFYPNPCLFSAKSPVSLCLPPSSCPLLFIASFNSIPRFTMLCLCGAPSISLSQISITVAPSCSVYLTLRWLHRCIYRRLWIVTLLCPLLCHFSAISKINYPSNKTINRDSSSVCATLLKLLWPEVKNTFRAYWVKERKKKTDRMVLPL